MNIPVEIQIIQALINFKKSKEFYYKEVQIEILKNLVNMLETDMKIEKIQKWQDEHKIKPLYPSE